MTMQFVTNVFLRARNTQPGFNLQTPGMHATVLFRLKEHLKSVGWVIQASSNATAFSTTPGNVNDVITTVDLMNQTRAWFVIKKPDDNRQFCFQVQRRIGSVTGAGNYTGFRIKYSISAGFTGGTPSVTQVPSAVDEQFPLGVYGADPARFGTDASPVFTDWLSNRAHHGTIFHIAADNAAPYGWWLAGYGMQGDGDLSGTAAFAGVFDPLTHTVPGDPDPYAFYFSWLGTTFKDELNLSFQPGQSALWGWLDYGGPNQLWMQMQVPFYDYMATQRRMQNPINNKVDRWPVVYGLPMTWPDFYTGEVTAPFYPYGYTDGFALSARGMGRGHKGVSTLMQFCNAKLSNGQAVKVTASRDKIVVGYVLLDWNGTVPVT